VASHDERPEVRPEVVEATFQALTSGDPANLIALETEGGTVTPAERAAAEDLYLAAAPGDLEYRDRKVEAIVLLAGTGGLADRPTWADLFDRFSPERLPELAGLYDALPDGARAEYDRRYGQPDLNADENDCQEMSAQDSAAWRRARTLAGLGELTAKWLEGEVKSLPTVIPGYGPDEETAGLIPVLAAVNRAGYMTDFSQPGAAEPGWSQRAAVSGFASAATFTALCAAAAGADLIINAAHAGTEPLAINIVVSLDGDEEYTWSGRAMTRTVVQDSYGPDCHPDAVEALCQAWQVSIIDPEWGRNDVLWPVLERFAARSA
jgi:hypothetical protein